METAGAQKCLEIVTELLRGARRRLKIALEEETIANIRVAEARTNVAFLETLMEEHQEMVARPRDT